uniref:exodeoxyribonuclease V subunit alpha n=1 Tax=Thaumasiovibrio occultus TaxID=1891184 RepID=UPI000B354BB3|nr:exodeoxyribonuclease V subunit alpha [Thaumasiovibrio occultus]
MLHKLAELVERGALRALDFQFAKYIAEQPNCSPQLALWAAELSYRVGQGHICIDVSQMPLWFDLNRADQAWLLDEYADLDVAKAAFAQAINQSCAALSDGSSATPLVLVEQRLYLARYWYDEQIVAGYLQRQTQTMATSPAMPSQLNQLFPRHYLALAEKLRQCTTAEEKRSAVQEGLDVVSPAKVDWTAVDAIVAGDCHQDALHQLEQLVPDNACLNWQKVAAAVALSRRFSVISGGPGTGKTTTVVRLLAALLLQADGDVPLIKLVAPTGKAAARLTESIGGALGALAVEPELKAQIPTEATTLHRLLGAVPNTVAFRHNASNPLHLDVLVVDEASMVDLPMMARLMEAMPPHARLILLGDKDQLASVEAGSVLGDICQFAEHGYSQAQAGVLSGLTGFSLPASEQSQPLSDCLCILQKSHRFHAKSGIGLVAGAVNQGNVVLLDRMLDASMADVAWSPLSTDAYADLLRQLVEAYRPTMLAAKSESPQAVLAQFNQVRLLCALREGDTGVEGMNQRIVKALRREGLISDKDELWYVGRPVMITRNDYALGLSNGDIGITLYDVELQRLRVYFLLPDGTIKGVLPSRLPTHETAFAMTIHKSQGSEFHHTFMLLPEKNNPVITRELIYTGITRAKQRLSMVATQAVLHQGIVRRTFRLSGLRSLLSI